MADVRDILIRLLGKETVSPEAKKAAAAVDDLGDEMSETAKDAKKLDDQIGDVEKSLKGLAQQYARTGNEDFVKQIRAQERELRKLKKARALLGDEDDGQRAGKVVAMGIAGQLRGAGKQFSEAIAGGLEAAPAPVKLAVAAVVVGGITAASTTIGGALAGAISSQAAIGGISLGVASAFRDPRIKAAGGELVNDLTDEFEELGEDFKAPVLAAIGSVRAQIPAIGGDLQDAIAPAAGYIEPLVNGFTGLVRNILPGFSKAIERAEPVIDVIGDALPRIGRAISSALDDATEHSDNAAAAIQHVLMFLEGTVIVTGKVVGWLADAYDITLKWQNAAAGTGEALFGWIPGVGGAFKDFHTASEGLVETTRGADQSTSDWALTLKGLTGDLSESERATEEMVARQQVLNSSMEDGIEAAGGLSKAFDLLNGKALSAREAEADYQQAIDDLTASIKENGRTLDLNTEKGRANDAQVRQLIKTVSQKAQAVYDETLATKGAAAAQAAASAVYEQGRQQLIKNLTQILGNKDAAVALADKIMSIPTSWNTTITADTTDAQKNADKFKKTVSGIPRHVFVKAEFDLINNADVAMAVRLGRMSGGGPVIGSGPKGVDSEPRLLAPGEHVLTADEVDAMGGQAAVAAFRRNLGRGGGTVMPTAAMAGGRGGTAPARGGRGELELVGEREVVAFVRRLVKQYRLLEG